MAQGKILQQMKIYLFLNTWQMCRKNTLIKSIADFAFQYRAPASKILKYNWAPLVYFSLRNEYMWHAKMVALVQHREKEVILSFFSLSLMKQFTHWALSVLFILSLFLFIVSFWQFTLHCSQCLGLQSKTFCPLVRNLFSKTMLPVMWWWWWENWW